MSGCCSGLTRHTGHRAATLAPHASAAFRASLMQDLCEIAGGLFEMGTNSPRYAADLSGPARQVRVSPFRLAARQVTNRHFARFIAESGYVTVAEREGWSFVFHLYATEQGAPFEGPAEAPWWRAVPGAFWAAPQGPGSDWRDRPDHPVVHVAWEDAQAFCQFTGLRLPFEAEWECAARGGLARKAYPWGEDALREGRHGHNVWQGHFPTEDRAEDGFAGLAPVGQYPPNGFGLYDMTGNAWDWCADWFGPLPHAQMPPLLDPKGPASGEERVIRGGSHLCHASYCERYFTHSRTRTTPDSSTGHISFRVAADPETTS
ncbi:formylglycine-generating enzyme family protein [Thioclava sp. GXIMD4215]|uniref:formylglycine-generating enzyme family protein n=1 Tax=Thioclava sp. GXIMD4215 TaxID=3131928 RepID=UPI00311B3D23